MRRLPIAPLLALAALATHVQAESPASGPQPPEPIATRQTIFAIPFQIEQAQQPAQEPVEVQLYVSTDRGATWRPYERVEPARGQFLFRAVGDGEYWFLVRTLDRSGQVRPQGPNRPELRVAVDTTPPTLQLQAVRGEAGQVITRWKVSELAPDRQSLNVHYRTSPDAPWQPVAIDWQNVKTDGPTQTGQVIWWPPAGAGNLQIRAEVFDLAGNPAVSHAQVKPEPATTAARQKPAESGVAAASAQEWRPAKKPTEAPTGPAAGATPTPSPAGDQTTAHSQAPEKPALPQKYPHTGDFAAQGPGAAASGSEDPSGRQPSPQAVETPPATGPARSGPPPLDPVASTVNPAVQDQYVPPARQEPPAKTAGLPKGVRPRAINSRVFELEYDAGTAGSAKLGRVELWGTRDGGRTWSSFGQDADGRSPMLLTVPDEGIYGFRVVAQGDPRSAPQPPRSGELPDVWIGVDLTRPTARIVSAERGTGTQSDPLVIHWEASDRMLADQPISLFYSELSGGSWSTIATALENTGVYDWLPEERVPEKVYLRLEVRDQAGNLGVYETPQAVSVQRGNTGARIRDVRPVSQSAYRVGVRSNYR